MANTEAPRAERRERRVPSWLPVLVALLAVGVFLGWLATRRPDTTGVAVAEPDQTSGTGGAVAEQPTGAVTDPAELGRQGGRPLVGQDIVLESVPVSSAMGPHFAWIDLPDGAPYLVRLDPDVVARGTSIPTGGRARVAGRVEMKDAAVISGWVEEGVLQEEGHRQQAEFGTTYILARQIQPVAN